MTRVLAVVHAATFGGPHNQVMRLRGELAALGIEVEVLLPSEPGDAAERLRGGGINVIELPLGRLRAVRRISSNLDHAAHFASQVSGIAKLLRQGEFDLLQAHGVTNIDGPLAAGRCHIGVVWQLVDLRAPLPLRWLGMRFVMRTADVLMTTGSSVANAHPGAASFGDRLIPFVPGLDVAALQGAKASRSKARALLRADTGALVFGCVGNQNPQKGHERLIALAAAVRRSIPGAILRIRGAVGPGHERYATHLQALVTQAGLDEDTLAPFPQGATASDLLPGYDVFTMTSLRRSEGIPTVLLEAMACGLPAVATDVGGIKEVLVDGATGSLVKEWDPRAFSQALTALLLDPSRRAAMGASASMKAAMVADVRSCARSHARAYALAIAHNLTRPVKGSTPV